jgi:N-sulfoglucosamine sulfohydrolase
MTRAFVSLAIALLTLSATSDASGQTRPNIVFVIADDWSFPHAGAYGDKVARTPNFDRVAREGVLFTRAYCASPSCTPSRGAILTGQAVHRLENGGNLWSVLPKKFAVYPDLLEASGYAVGLTGKGWGPGDDKGDGRTRNPAGPRFPNFKAFLESFHAGRPFCYWFGSQDPHRPYDKGTGAKSGLNPADVTVPAFLPDTPEIRDDVLDYYFEVNRFDRDLGAILKELDDRGLAANTLVVVTSDNGMPFPRAKANLYDSGTHMPLAMKWPSKLPKGLTIDAFVSHADFAPTFLGAAGLATPDGTTGRSLLTLIEAVDNHRTVSGRDAVFLERERHANVREANQSYPSRAIRTEKHLYIRNLRPDRWPAGDPVLVHSVGPFGDVDGSPSKDLILDFRADLKFKAAYRLAFEKRPAEELYDLEHDPQQLKNVAHVESYASDKAKLRARLQQWMSDTADPLVNDSGAGREPFDDYPYLGPPLRDEQPKVKARP